ncbi:MAG: SagB/ThcOx family dehydrogenase [Anaerolineae bacterium]
MTRRSNYDMRYLTSALLLVAVVAAFLTGWLSDAWGINTFIVHTYAGYAMAVLALIHTLLEWPRLWAYARSRLQPRGASATRRDTPAATEAAEDTPAATGAAPSSAVPEKAKRFLSRRDLLSALLGGAGGLILGWRLGTPAAQPEEADLGMQYHAWSKPGVPNPLAPLLDWGQRPPQYKVYPDAPRIPLPDPGDARGLSLEDAIRQRRSVRTYTGASMTREALSRLLFHTGGITAEQWSTGLRAAPSAGALYPIETYVLAHRVEGLDAGVYHYAVQDHALAQVRAGDVRNEIVRAGILQNFLGEANVVLVLTSIFQRLRWKYRERTYRYALLEAGHIGQNVYLAATSLGMGACAVGAFNDDAVNALVGVEGVEEAALYVLAVGAQATV